jgi:hypothetical protein
MIHISCMYNLILIQSPIPLLTYNVSFKMHLLILQINPNNLTLSHEEYLNTYNAPHQEPRHSASSIPIEMDCASCTAFYNENWQPVFAMPALQSTMALLHFYIPAMPWAHLH